jgi:hypothetical protein
MAMKMTAMWMNWAVLNFAVHIDSIVGTSGFTLTKMEVWFMA